jgi:murein DD-endopeptidase MepM/ murein hydrolase activator NlpD
VVLHVGWYTGNYADNPYWIQPGFAGWCYVVRHTAWFGTFIGIYGHCMENAARVTVGQSVKEGQVLGLSGNTGASTGDHLHFEIMFEPFLVNSYMYGRSNPTTLFAGPITYAGTTIEALEEISMAAEENIMARLAQIVEWEDNQFREIRNTAERNRNMLAGFVRDVVNAKQSLTSEQLDAKFRELTANQPVTGEQLFKGDGSPEVYAWDAAGGFRHIAMDEYLALITGGATLRELPQPVLEAAVGGK